MSKSIKTRMTIFIATIVFVLLTIFGGFLYWGLKAIIYRHFDQRLLVFADAIEDSYDPANNDFKFLEEKTENYFAARKGWVRIIDWNETILFQSDPFVKNPAPFPFEKAKELTTESYFYRQFKRENGKVFRSIILPVVNRISAEKIGWVEAGESVKEIENTLAFFRKLLLLSLPIALLFVAIVSYWMVNRLIQPVSAMAEQTEKISYTNLDERLPIINPNDELGRLGTRFNMLLDRLENAFQTQRQFLNNVSHELKTPITILRNHWEKATADNSLPDSIRRRLNTDVEELVRLSKMVSDLSLLSHSLEMHPALKREQVSLTEMLHHLVEDIRLLANQKNQSIEFLGNEPVQVNGEPRFLKRLFLNLLDNAVKYTPDNGSIRVSCSMENGHAVVCFSDNGIGINSQDLPHIFDRFYRASNVHSNNAKGTGLGLSIAKWIAEAHHGSLEITSQPKQGSTFKVKLPLVNNV